MNEAMNQAMHQAGIQADAFILGNVKLHQRFSLATEILAALMNDAQPVSMTALQKRTGQPARELARLCSLLWQTRMITPAPAAAGWTLLKPDHAYTLEDVFRSVMENMPGPAQMQDMASPKRTPETPRTRLALDAFIGQATMAVNQSLSRHLRQYPLERLRDASGDFPICHTSRYDAGCKLAHASRQT